MPNFLIDEDTELLAAEFVLGTLDAEERANAQSLLRIDRGFIAMVRIWERRLSELHLMVEPVEPDPKILERIKEKLPQTAQGEAPTGTRLMPQPPPELPQPVAAPEPASAESPQASDTEGQAAAAAPAETSTGLEPAAAVAEEGAAIPTETPLEAAPDVASGAEAQPISHDSRSAEAVVRSERTAEPSPVLKATAPRLPDTLLEGRPVVLADASLKVRRSRARWRLTSFLLLLLVVAAAGLVAAWRFVPDQVPGSLQPSQLMSSIGIGQGTNGPPQRPKPSSPPQFDE